LDDRRRDGGTNFILRIKEQETRLTVHEYDDDDDFDDEEIYMLGKCGYRHILKLCNNYFFSTPTILHYNAKTFNISGNL